MPIGDRMFRYVPGTEIAQQVTKLVDWYIDIGLNEKVAPTAMFDRKLQAIPVRVFEISNFEGRGFESRDVNIDTHANDTVIGQTK